jgi:predicted nuclease of predicted toxin-antitoxin system
MKIKLYLDEDVMNDDLLLALRARGVDVVSVRETLRQGYSDEEQLEYATSRDRVIYSFNTKDYVVLHTIFTEQGRSHAGIIVAEQRQRYSIGEHLRRLLAIMTEKSAEEMRAQLLYLSNWG